MGMAGSSFSSRPGRVSPAFVATVTCAFKQGWQSVAGAGLDRIGSSGTAWINLSTSPLAALAAEALELNTDTKGGESVEGSVLQLIWTEPRLPVRQPQPLLLGKTLPQNPLAQVGQVPPPSTVGEDRGRKGGEVQQATAADPKVSPELETIIEDAHACLDHPLIF
eukprot:CAMPEP_0181185750 /NCGR_PEP_ID=MMETSP1096-20121128/9674_1 /TAXON_ID=156174 ORGANISM="Chrysochromulina ericina, Strain CCMP281" /NCGR_SAMPLE_ID=MMETSP1096 /ASSEMBLY_ACC=CAM_ASM_000453 /LENGTH=164 /DNA_ID=CAMNT_0023274615 /DNA_START=309 /DNA_END=802 /DNA_ORIENTATION=-